MRFGTKSVGNFIGDHIQSNGLNFFSKKKDVPGYTYFNSLMNGPVNWGYQTIEQSGLSGRTLPFPRGKVLGGSSAVNGLYVVRPSKLEVDAWAALGNASDTLNWDKLLAGMKKSESFAQPADDVASAGNIQYDPASHGTDGPIHIGWPGYMHPLVGQWQGALAEAQIGYTKDPNNGDNWGG
jgi:choline dehydrogenase